MIKILKEYIPEQNIVWLLEKIIKSFSSTVTGLGLPLGNLTSQLFVNIYMNEFDRFVKHKLKVEYYIRYADDFIILNHDRKWLEDLIPKMTTFLKNNLKLLIHPNKIFIKTVASGVDFLGWVHFPDHRILRTTTGRRMMKRIKTCPNPQTLNSYLGLLKHGNTNNLKEELFKSYINTY